MDGEGLETEANKLIAPALLPKDAQHLEQTPEIGATQSQGGPPHGFLWEICMAEGRAEKAFDRFLAKYQAKYDKAAQKSWRKLDGQNQVPKIIQGVKITDGIEIARDHATA